MLSCSEVENLLSAYYDGELGVAASQQVEKHLASCKSCMAKLEKMHVITSAVRGIDFPQADDGFQAMLGERLERAAAKMKPNKTARILKFIRPYAAAAACLVLAVGIYTAVDRGYFSQTEQPENSIAVQQPVNEIKGERAAEKSAEPTAKPTAVPSGKTAVNTIPAQSSKPEEPARTAAPKTETQNTAVSDSGKNAKPAEAKDSVMEAVTPQPAEEAADKANINTNNVNNTADADTPVLVQSTGNAGGGGGSAEKKFDITVTFTLDSAEKTAYIEQILAQYGEVSQSGTAIRAKVLAANFDACLATLRAVDGLTETGSAKTEGSGEHGSIVINF